MSFLAIYYSKKYMKIISKNIVSSRLSFQETGSEME